MTTKAPKLFNQKSRELDSEIKIDGFKKERILYVGDCNCSNGLRRTPVYKSFDGF